MREISEWRLRPVWDAIESRQFKTALKLTSQLQNKYRDSPYVLALRALVLERMGKPDEALATCREAKSKQPVDNLTLGAMQAVYQRLGLIEEAIEAYDFALSKTPGDLELLISLFSCYVKQQNYVKQQQTASKIHKITREEKYLYWAVCSIYLQVRPMHEMGNKLLTLAEALIKKSMDTNGLRELEVLRMYILLLRDQGKNEDALAVLSGDLGALFTIPVERLRLQGELLMVLKRFSEAASVFKDILQLSSDDWSAISQFMNASLEYDETSSIISRLSSLSISYKEIHARLDTVAEVMLALEQQNTHEVRRGPSLALVEIEHRRLLHEGENPAASYSMNLAEAITKYFERFGHLTSFFPDVKEYLSALDRCSQESFICKLTSSPCLADPTDPIKLLRRKIAVYQVEELFGRRSNDLKVVREMVQLFQDNLKYSANLDPEDSVIGEELLVLAANHLVKAFIKTGQLSLITEAICLLEFGLSLRRFNGQFKVMLIGLYSSAYAPALAFDWFKALDIKNILCETSSHHILPLLLTSPNWQELELILSNSVKFHEDYQIEAGEMAIMAYKHGNYMGTVEFAELNERLVSSHHYLLVRIEQVILSLKQNFEKLDVLEDILTRHESGLKCLRWTDDHNLAKLKFNEDLGTRPWWSPVPDENFLIGSARECSDIKEQVSAYMERSKASMRRRSLLPRLLFLAFNSLSPEKHAVHEEIKQLLEFYLKGLSPDVHSTDDLLYTAKNRTVDGDADILSVQVFHLACQLCSMASVDGILSSVVLLGEALTSSLKELLKSSSSENLESPVPSLVKLISEPITWLALCMQVWLRQLLPMKKKKKPNEIVEEKNVGKLVDSLRKLALCISVELEMVVAWVRSRTSTPEEVVERFISASRLIQLVEGGPGLPAFQSWKARETVKSLVRSQRSALLGLESLCGRMLRFFRAMK